jgi:hypothetical protein
MNTRIIIDGRPVQITVRTGATVDDCRRVMVVMQSVRDGSGVPRFSHGLIDQSGLQPEEVQGELKARIMQLVMLAAYHPALAWMEQVARLLDALSSLAPSGGINDIRISPRTKSFIYLSARKILYMAEVANRNVELILFRYLFVLDVLSTQEPEAAQSFRDVCRRYAPAVGDDLMTYAQELLAEGEARGKVKGRMEERVKMIEGLLQEGVEWSVIERVSGVNEVQFQALKQELEDMNE